MVVEHPTQNPRCKGSNPGTAARREKMEKRKQGKDSMVVKNSACNLKSKDSNPANGTRRENVKRRIK